MDILPLTDIAFNGPLLIAGPCSAETEDQVLQTAVALKALQAPHFFRAGVWKPRTRPGAFEGVGERALPWMQQVKTQTGLRPIIEVATPHQLELALKSGIDAIWIGARTTVNPFSVQELAEALAGTDIVVLVKNPVNPDVSLWVGAIERIFKAGIKKLGAIHRGFSQYGQNTYRNAPIWEIPIEFRRILPELPMIGDNSHICGNRHLLLKIAQSGLNLGFDGLMTEVHPDPDAAWTDARQQVTPTVYAQLISQLQLRRNSSNEDEVLHQHLVSLRTQIDDLDRNLIGLLAERMQLTKEIGQSKKMAAISILEMRRFNEILHNAKIIGAEQGLDAAFLEKIMSLIHAEGIALQQQL